MTMTETQPVIDAEMVERPVEPTESADVWYRGWEVGFDDTAHRWSGEGWRAYKGGCDLDAPTVSAATFIGCLNEIDEAEDA